MRPVGGILVAGARPNFMKIAPIMRAINKHPQLESVLVHTGQHYDKNMSGTAPLITMIFFTYGKIPAWYSPIAAGCRKKPPH